MQVDIIRPQAILRESKRYFLTDSPDFITMPFSDFERVLKGEKKGRAKKCEMNKETVLNIYNSKDDAKKLAKLHNVSYEVVRKIKAGESYRKYLNDNRAL